MKWMSSLATCLETVIDRICWQNFWRSENPYKVSFQPANQQKLSWWSSLSTASCSSQWPRKRGTVRHRTCPPAFERDEEQIWLSLAEIQNRHRPITITYSHSSGSAWRNENYLPVSQSQSIRITNAQTEKLQPFGVLLLCVLNLDHMCQRSSLGLGCQVFAPGMLICPQKSMLFCRRAAPNFVVPQQTIQRKGPIRMTLPQSAATN